MDCIGVIGAGVMGRGIVQVSAAAGFRVKVFDVAVERAAAGVEFAAGMLRRAAEKGQMTQAAAEAAVARIEVCAELRELRDATMVIEAAAENLDVKQKLFSQLESVVNEDAILATNTSSLVVTQIASACRRPQRVAGLHFFNPVPLMKLVEIIPGLVTDPTVVERLKEYVRRIGHTSVVAADSPGFLVNHAGRAFYTEGVRIVSEGIAGVPDVDRVAREALGFRMGPFELFDHTGLDVSYPVLTQIYHQFFEEPRFRPHPLLARQFAAGLFGKKSGRGFYRYEGGTRVEATEEKHVEGSDRPLWIADRGEDGRKLQATQRPKISIAPCGSVSAIQKDRLPGAARSARSASSRFCKTSSSSTATRAIGRHRGSRGARSPICRCIRRTHEGEHGNGSREKRECSNRLQRRSVQGQGGARVGGGDGPG